MKIIVTTANLNTRARETPTASKKLKKAKRYEKFLMSMKTDFYFLNVSHPSLQ